MKIIQTKASKVSKVWQFIRNLLCDAFMIVAFFSGLFNFSILLIKVANENFQNYPYYVATCILSFAVMWVLTLIH